MPCQRASRGVAVRPIAFLLTAFLVVCSPVEPDAPGAPDPAEAPRLASVSPGADEVRVEPGATVEFHVEATSPRAKALTITYLVDGAPSATASSFSFRPAAAGSYRVSAVVSDGELEVVHEWIVTVEPPNASPAIVLSIEPASGSAPLSPRIRVRGDDPDGRVVRYRLELVGPLLLTLERPFPIDTVLTLDTGSWQATAVVEDNGGATAVAGRGIEVSPLNLPPAPDLRVEPLSGEAPLEVVVDAGGTDPDGEIVSYILDIEGESITESASPIRRSARFERAGSYRVRLAVTDDRGAETRDSLAVHVTERPPDPPDPHEPPPSSGAAPTASLLVTPADGDAPLEVEAHVAGHDADGSVATIRIDFDGDGEADASGNRASLDASFRYGSPGTYAVTATVVDDEGMKGTAVAHVTVRQPANLPPSGSLSLSVTGGDAPLEVRATASGSDPDGRIVKWEIEAHAGDGFLELDASRSATLVYAFHESPYVPRLRLTDDAGAAVTIEGAAVRVYRPIAGGEATVEGNPRFDATAIAPAVWSDGQDRWRFSVTVRDRRGEPLSNVRLRLASDRPALMAPDGTPLGPGVTLVSGELRTAADGTAAGMLTTTLSTRIERAPVIDFRPFVVRLEADAGHGQWREVARLEGLNANSTVSATASRVIVRPANQAVCPGTPIEIEVQARSRTDAPSPGSPAAGRYAELRFTDGSLVSATPRTGYAAWRTDATGVIRFAYAPTRADQSKLVEAWVDGQPIGELAILALEPPSRCSS